MFSLRQIVVASQMLTTAAAGSNQVEPREFAPDVIVRKVRPAIVAITSFSGASTATGSGFIVDPSGKIVTNLHVIRNADALQVKIARGDIFDQVSVLAFDERRDLAVLQIPGFGLPSVILGDSDAIVEGERVIVIGNPSGFEGSVSSGIVSGVRILGGVRWIQTDAAANSGNSGGPVVHSNGKVIGVLTWERPNTEGLNFAAPINYARGLLSVNQPITLQELRSRLAARNPIALSGEALAFPFRWLSISSGLEMRVRRDGDHIYAQAVFSEASRSTGAFWLADVRKVGNGYWGTARHRFSCSLAISGSTKLCTVEGAIRLTEVSPNRIEGEAERNSSAFRCGQCRYSGASRMEPFIWIANDPN